MIISWADVERAFAFLDANNLVPSFQDIYDYYDTSLNKRQFYFESGLMALRFAKVFNTTMRIL